MTILLDMQRGHLTLATGSTIELDASEMALLYWSRLAAPDYRVADALEVTNSDLPALRCALAGRLGHEGELRDLPIVLNNGVWPQSFDRWQERTAVTLIQRGLLDPGLDQNRVLVFVAGQGSLTLGEVAQAVRAVLAGLVAAGIQKGDYVAVDATQCIETFIVAAATFLRGASLVRLGDNVPASSLQQMLSTAPAKITFSARLAEIGGMHEAGIGIALGDQLTFGVEHFDDWLERHIDTPSPAPEAVQPDDVAQIGFTSGSTGAPKKVLNTHESIWRSTEVAVALHALGASDVFCSATDIVSSAGLRSMLTLPLMTGGKVLFLSPSARRSPLLQALECKEHGVTCITGGPNVLRGFVMGYDRIAKLPSLRTVLSDSGILDSHTTKAFRELFGVAVVDVYGKREITHVLCSRKEHNLPLNSRGGRAMQTLLRVLDPQGMPVEPGVPGELFVLTDCMAKKTEGCTRAEGAKSHPGWHPSGDIGVVDEDGAIRITGRLSEVIKTRDGQLLFPIEVETVLLDQADVREACAFSVTDESQEERIGAAVILERPHHVTPDSDMSWTLRRQVQAALGPFRTPDNILLLADFPRLARHKPDRRRLIEIYRSEFCVRKDVPA